MLALEELVCIVGSNVFNTLNAEINPICHLLALLGAHHILHVSGVRVKLSSLRRLLYIQSVYIF